MKSADTFSDLFVLFYFKLPSKIGYLLSVVPFYESPSKIWRAGQKLCLPSFYYKVKSLRHRTVYESLFLIKTIKMCRLVKWCHFYILGFKLFPCVFVQFPPFFMQFSCSLFFNHSLQMLQSSECYCYLGPSLVRLCVYYEQYI